MCGLVFLAVSEASAQSYTDPVSLAGVKTDPVLKTTTDLAGVKTDPVLKTTVDLAGVKTDPVLNPIDNSILIKAYEIESGDEVTLTQTSDGFVVLSLNGKPVKIFKVLDDALIEFEY